MPVCTNCAHPADHLYTTYRTKSNIRLGVCPRCDAFLDPLIEHPDLVLLLDLILLKPRVFLHLLFNRGSPAFDAVAGSGANRGDSALARRLIREKSVYDDLWILGIITVIVETAVRLLPTITDKEGLDSLSFWQIGRTIGMVLLQGAAQHLVTMGAAVIVLAWRDWYPSPKSRRTTESNESIDGRQANFTPALIPLTVLYTSLLPLLLQLVLPIWYTPPVSIHESLPSSTNPLPTSLLASLPLPSSVAIPIELVNLEHTLNQAWLALDRIWIGTRLLGGMSAGFGLRVLLPTKPWETTGIVLVGWMAAGLVGWLMEVMSV